MRSFRRLTVPLRNSMVFVVLFTGGSGFLLGALTRPTWQVAVESAQVLAGLVSYPAHNSFYIYHLKLWTIVNQLAALALALGGSERFLSVFISGGIAALSYVAVGLCVFAISRNAFWAIASPFLVDFTHVQDVLSVNYPMDFMGTPHSYGVIGLAWILITFSLIAAGRYSSAGMFLGLAPAAHPSMGVWCWVITPVVLLWVGPDSLRIARGMWKTAAAGAAISVGSLLLQVIWMRPVLPYVDASTQARFVSAWVDFFDFHRRPVYFTLPGIELGLASVFIGLYLILILDEERDAAALFMLKTTVVTAALALGGAAVSQLPASIIPGPILTLMPTRLFLLSNLAFMAALLGLLGRFPNVWVRIAGMFMVLALASGNQTAALYSLVLTGFVFMVWKSVSLPNSGRDLTPGRQWPTVVTGIALVGLIVAGVIGRVQTASQYRNGMSDRTNSAVLASAAATGGVLVIGPECCPLTQLRTRRPLLVETGGLDQLPYAPESGPDMNAALTAVYGVDLLHPQEILRSAGFAEDLAPVTRPLWEARSPEQWKRLGAAFGFTSILTNPNWILKLPEIGRDSESVLYTIPPS